MNRFTFLACLLLILPSAVSASDVPDRQEATKRIEHSIAKTNIFDLPSFQMKANLQVDNQGKPLDGTLELLWNGPAQWREEIHFPGYSEVDVGGKGTVWIKRSTDFIPIDIFHLYQALGFGTTVLGSESASLFALYLTSKDNIAKVHSEKRHGEKLTCYQIAREDIHSSEICIRDATGTLARDPQFEDSDFMTIDGKSFPGLLSMAQNGKALATVRVTQLATPATLPLNAFDPLSGVSPQAGCMNPTPDRIVKKVVPEYPQAARQRHIEGSVGVDVRIGTDGVTRIGKTVSSPNPDLERSTLAAIRGWRYQPATCEGQPVEVETVLIVNYSLR